jgi:hypothetical protein
VEKPQFSLLPAFRHIGLNRGSDVSTETAGEAVTAPARAWPSHTVIPNLARFLATIDL